MGVIDPKMLHRQTILLIALLIVGCEETIAPDSNPYSATNLGGIWMGSVTSTGSALPDGTIIDMGYEFDSQGNLVDWIGGPEVLSMNGNLDISGIGDITGTTTTTHINGNNAEESTVCNWQGSQLVSINTIEVNMQCDWTTNDGSSGSYNFSGSMDKSTEPQDCAGVAGGIAELDNCGNCIDGGVGADGWNNCDFEATIDDYIGTWVGIGVFNAELEDDSDDLSDTMDDIVKRIDQLDDVRENYTSKITALVKQHTKQIKSGRK